MSVKGPLKYLWISLVLVILFCLVSYFFIDRPLAFYFLSLQPRLNPVSKLISRLGYSAWYLCGSIALSFIYRFVYKDAHSAFRWLFVFLSILISGILNSSIKFITGRYRPEMLIEHNLYGFDFFHIQGRLTSFPSGHANAITALAVSLYFIYPKYRLIYALIAILVMVSRLALCDHFLSDVVFGSYLGIVTTLYLKHAFENRGLAVFEPHTGAGRGAGA